MPLLALCPQSALCCQTGSQTISIHLPVAHAAELGPAMLFLVPCYHLEVSCCRLRLCTASNQPLCAQVRPQACQSSMLSGLGVPYRSQHLAEGEWQLVPLLPCCQILGFLGTPVSQGTWLCELNLACEPGVEQLWATQINCPPHIKVNFLYAQ